MPNPSGGAGVYVLPWDQATLMYRPTVHDKRLSQYIRCLVSISPGSIRQAAREVAAEGLAGREACTAATEAVAADRNARRLLDFLMLVRLLERIEPTGIDIGGFAAPSPALQQRAWSVVIAAAPQLSLVPEAIAQDLEQLADAFVTIGLDGQAHPARVPALLARVVRLHQETVAWSRGQCDHSGDLAAMISEAADVTVALAATALRQARAAIADLPTLLQRWSVAGEVRRIATLLGGLLAEAGPAQRMRMEKLLQRLDASCVTRFTAGLSAEFIRPLEALNIEADDADIARLEVAARGLSELGAQARGTGSRETCATLLRQTVDIVKAITSGGALKLADRVRLVEILAGPEEAWALLQRQA